MNKLQDQLKGTNCVAYGQSRDEYIVKLIQSGTAFTRQQIEQIIIPKRKSSKRIAQHSLTRLCKQERIKQWKRAPQLPSIYYARKPRQLDHVLLVNEIYCALLAQKKSWHVIEWKWNYLILGGKVVADAMATIYAEPDRKGRRVVFIEVERNPGKRFDKPEQYQKVYDADWVNEEWSVIKNNTAIFPAILIVTEEKPTIKSDLNFIVASIGQVQKDVYGLLRR
ncbi:MAG: hypothetical protein WA125_16915 [Desulfosporosinus sp.]